MRTLLIAALLAAGPVLAAKYQNDTVVAKNPNGDVVRLWDSPCKHENVLKRIRPEYREQFRQAQATISGQEFLACWIVDGQNVYFMYEDGDQALIPMSEFKPDQGV